MRRTPLGRRAGRSRSGALPPVSPRRAALEQYVQAARSQGLTRTGGLRPRSAKTEAIYRTLRRPLVAALFAEPSICEVPWCAERATDPHEVLPRGRGGSITDRANIRLVCNPHNVMFASDEQPWMYDLGFLRHSGGGS